MADSPVSERGQDLSQPLRPSIVAELDPVEGDAPAVLQQVRPSRRLSCITDTLQSHHSAAETANTSYRTSFHPLLCTRDKVIGDKSEKLKLGMHDVKRHH